MSTTNWNPEVASLLREIAADEQSVLRELPPVTVGELLKPHALSDTKAFLTRAEKQLVTVYREQLARLLNDTACGLMFGDERSRGLVYILPEARRASLPTPRNLRTRAQALRQVEGEDDSTEAREIIRRALLAPEFGRPTPADLLGMSIRLVPAARARLLLTLWLSISQRPRTALQLGAALLARVHRTNTRGDVHSYLGRAHHELGDAPRALNEYRAASSHHPGYSVVTCPYLFQAIRLGDAEQARVAAQGIREDDPTAGEVADVLRRSVEASMARSVWYPSKQATELAKRLHETNNDAVRTIAAAFARSTTE